MPEIPLQKTQQVFSQGNLQYQNINPNPNAFGADVGQALSNAGQGMAQASNNIQDIVSKQAENEANQADLKLGLANNATAFDPKTGYLSQQGQNAVDGLKDYQGQVQQNYKDTRSTLSPMAAKMFDSIATRRTLLALQTGAEHASQQNNLVEGKTYEGQIALDNQYIANSAGDDKALQLYGNTLDQHVLQYSKWMGYPAGSTAENELLTQHRSAAYSNVINQTLANGNVDRAQQLFQQFNDKGWLTPQTKEAVGDRLESTQRNVDAVNFSDQAVSSARKDLFDGSGNMTVSSTDAIYNMGNDVSKQASDAYLASHPGDTIGAKRTQEETRSQWRSDIYEPALKQQQDNHFGLMTQIDKGNITNLKTLLSDPTMAKQYQSLDPQYQSAIDAHLHQQWSEQQSEVRADRADKRYEAALDKQDKAQNSGDLRDSYLGQSITDPQSFLALDPSKYSANLTPADFIKVASVQRSMQEKNNAAMQHPINGQQLKSIDLLVQSAGLNPNAKKGTQDYANYNNFVGRLSASVQDYQNANKRPLKDDNELSDIARGLLTNTTQTTPGTLWDSHDTKQMWQLSPDDEDKYNADIPAGQRSTLTNFFTQHYGRPPQEDELQMLNTAQTLHRGNKAYFNQLDTAFKARSKQSGPEVPD